MEPKSNVIYFLIFVFCGGFLFGYIANHTGNVKIHQDKIKDLKSKNETLVDSKGYHKWMLEQCNQSLLEAKLEPVKREFHEYLRETYGNENRN